MTASVLAHDVGDVARVVIDRPASCNALTAEMTRQLSVVMTELGRDTSIAVVLLSANGADFCAGMTWATSGRRSRPNGRSGQRSSRRAWP